MISKNIVFAVVCCVSLVFAFPHDRRGHGLEPAGHQYQTPGPLDSRSPCPGLNAMANHGFLPHSGKNISYDDINTASMQAYNFASGVHLPIFLATNETFNLSTTGNSLTINLRDLTRHNTIEVDGSLSRNDLYFGDDYHFDAGVFAGTSKALGLDEFGSNNGHVTVETAAKAHVARLKLASAVNPHFKGGKHEETATLATTGLFLTTLWDHVAQGAPKEWVKVFFEQDRIPYEQGYTAPKVKTKDFFANMISAVTNATKAMNATDAP